MSHEQIRWFLLGVIAIFVIEGIRMESGSVGCPLGRARRRGFLEARALFKALRI